MKLRELRIEDAPLMLEWMHDKSVVADLKADFASKTIEDAEAFINDAVEMYSKKDNELIDAALRGLDLHFAIVSDEDEYMGTVSLKHITETDAEFGITVRTAAMGHGYSWFGMKAIIEKAFNELRLESVYWCVSRNNERAVRFYDKHNFHEALDIPKTVLDRYEGMDNLKWYSCLKGDEIDTREFVAGCRVIRIKTIPTVDAGELSFFEGTHDIPFDIKRIYYISKVPEGVRRGFHAHKKLRQVLFCPYGRIQLILENKHGREEIELSDPSVGVVIEEPTWREMLWLEKNSVLCVAASEYYEVEDYIRDYTEFRNYIQ
ncbi:MAG: GNAT family N-acetyltransferase [Eubacterium sp.]|nr:GNAT family N-acetyltransferase [Eubacterium sp.]